MGHNVGKQAALVVAAGQKRASAVAETRTPEEIIKTVRNNLTNTMTIMKTDIGVLMTAYDDMVSLVNTQADAINDLVAAVKQATEDITILKAQNEQLRVVYEQENSTMTVKVERTVSDYGTGPDGIGTPDMP